MAWIWVRALAGDGTVIWEDATATTGAGAGVGTWTGDGREVEVGIWEESAAAVVAPTWATGMTETGADEGAGLKAWVWIWA